MSNKNKGGYVLRDNFGIPTIDPRVPLCQNEPYTSKLAANLVEEGKKTKIGIHLMFSMMKKYEMYNLISHPIGSMVISAMDNSTPLVTKTILTNMADLILNGCSLEINHETSYEKSLVSELSEALCKTSEIKKKEEIISVLNKMHICTFFSYQTYIIPVMVGSKLWEEIVNKSSAFIFRNIKGIFVLM